MDVNERTLNNNGLKIHFWEAGEGGQRTILLIHGGIGDAKLHWWTAMPALAEEFHVLAPDLPGFGGSDVLPRMETAHIIDWLKAFLDVQHIEQAVVIGNSLGGLVARLFAAAHPTYVPALILVNGGGVPDMPGFIRALGRIPGVSNLLFYTFGQVGTSPGTLKKMLHDQTLLTEDFYNQARAVRPGFSRMMQMFTTSPMPKAQNPPVPTLILWGAEDQIASLQEGERIHDSLPGSTLTDIKDCGHMPQLETMDVFVWQVHDFLDRLSRPSAKHPGAGILPNIPS